MPKPIFSGDQIIHYTVKHDIIYRTASTVEDLRQILKLQQENLPQALSSTEKEAEGFLTVHHSFEILKRMNDRCPHIIATHDNRVVGYTLCMLEEFKNDIPVLVSMFTEIDNTLRMLQKSHLKYLIMGQVCVAKAYRKQGIFRGLYEFMRTGLNPVFDAVITEVDAENVRSSNAHKAVGFEMLKTYTSKGKHWELIIWNWR